MKELGGSMELKPQSFRERKLPLSWETRRKAFEELFLLGRSVQNERGVFDAEWQRQSKALLEGSALPKQETRRVLNGARAQEKKLESEVAQETEATSKKRLSLLRKWMGNPLFMGGLVSAALHGVFFVKGMELPDDVKKEMPQMVLQPQSVAEMERIESQRAEREKRIDHHAVSDYKQTIRDRIKRGEPVSFEELYLDLEQLNGVPESDVNEAKQRVADLTDQFSVSMGSEIDAEKLRGFVGVMYGDDSNYDWGQGSVVKYFKTGKRNGYSVDKGEVIVLENVVHRLPPEEQARYSIGINKIKQHEMATITIRDRDGGGIRTYILEGDVPMIEGSLDDPGSKTIPLEDLKKSIVAEQPTVVQATAGKVAQSPDLIFSTNQPVDDGIRIEGPLRGSDYVIEQTHRQGIEPVEVKQREWGTTEVTRATPEDEAAYERQMKHGESAELRSAFDLSYRANRFLNRAEGYINAKEYALNTWFNQQGPVTAEKVKKVNEWSGQERVNYIYHGALHEFEDAAVKEIPLTRVGTVSVLYLPEENTERIELLLDAAEGPKKPMVELQIREHELGQEGIQSHAGTVREEIRKIVARKNLESVALVFKRFSVRIIESDENVIAKKDAQLNRLNSRTAYDIANGKIKDVYLSGRTITPGDLLVLEHGKARIHIDLDEYVPLLLEHQSLLGSDKIVPWVRTQNMAMLAIPGEEFSEPVKEELYRLHAASLQLPDGLPPEPHAGMDH